jgi:archaellum component FlaC
MEITLKTCKIDFNGKRIGVVREEDIGNMVDEKINQHRFAEGALERLEEKIENTQKFIALLVETLAEKKIFTDEDLMNLLDTSEIRIMEVIRKGE